jgi:hypothetical protein
MPEQGSKKTTGNLFPPPSPDLYIYLMKGVLREKDEEFLCNAFIGNWVDVLEIDPFVILPPWLKFHNSG